MPELILNKENFEKEVLKAEGPVVVDFWAPWCGPCQMMAPVISELAEKAEGRYSVGKVNVDEENELSERFRIMSIPSIKVFKNGEVVASSIGYTPQGRIMEMLADK